MLLALAVAAGTAAAATAPWHKSAPLLHPRAAHAVVTDGRSIYALAGTGVRGAPVLEVERFAGTRWRAETTLPGGGLNAPAAAMLNGRIYLIGGFDSTSNVPVTTTRVYDTATKRWSTAAPLPAARGGHAAVVLGGRIHVLGGGDNERTLALHTVYDPATDRWTDLAPLPRPKGSVAAVVFGGRIYAIGGRSGRSDFGDVNVYDPRSDRWTAATPIAPRGTAGAVAYHGWIYVVGGESQRTAATLRSMLRWNPGLKAWQRVASMPTPRSFARAVVFRDRIYVIGGSRFFGDSHAAEGSRVVEAFRLK